MALPPLPSETVYGNMLTPRYPLLGVHESPISIQRHYPDGPAESTTALANTFIANARSPGVTTTSSAARGLRLTAPIVKVTGAEAVPLLPSVMVCSRKLSVMPCHWRAV